MALESLRLTLHLSAQDLVCFQIFLTGFSLSLRSVQHRVI